MLYALLALAVFGLITSSVFAGMALAAVPRYLRERREAFTLSSREPGFTPPLTAVQTTARRRTRTRRSISRLSSSRTTRVTRSSSARALADDAGLATARRVAARYPEVPTSVPLHRRADLHQRQSLLHGADGAARRPRHSSSSPTRDVRVTPDYLRSVALPFSDRQRRRPLPAPIAAWLRKADSGRDLKPSACPWK